MTRATLLLATSLILALIVACGPARQSDGNGEDGLLGQDPANNGAANNDGLNNTTPDNNLAVDNNIDDTVGNCAYPDNNGVIGLGKVMPRLAWQGIYRPDGSTMDFDLLDFYCNDAVWGEHSVAIFWVGAEWCPACKSNLETMASEGMTADIEANGGVIFFVETQTNDGAPATHEDAHRIISASMGDAPGLRVGDGQTQPEPNTLYNAPLIVGFPGSFVVRRSDMIIIADQGSSEYLLPFADIAADPSSVWDTFDPDEEPSCGLDDEEPSEPNDKADQAATLEPGDYTGGICNVRPDFYKIDIDGHWLFELRFSVEDGDLDFYLWDEDNDLPVTNGNGTPIGSISSDDNEVFQWQGPAMIKIFGYNGSTAPYEITLVELWSPPVAPQAIRVVTGVVLRLEGWGQLGR